MMNKKPFILLLAIILLAGLAIVARPGANAEVAKAAEQAGTTFYLPYLFKGLSPSSVFGVDLGTISNSTGLEQMKQANAVWVRRGNFLWPSVEPNKGDRNWNAMAGIESELVTASVNNLKTILVIQNAPTWALQNPTGPACGAIKPEEYATFASFVHDVVARYSQPPYNVKYFEIGNEPDAFPGAEPDQVFGCWGDTNDAQFYGGKAYGEMLKVVYPEAKTASSQAQILIGGILLGAPPSDTDASGKFLTGVLEAGAGNSFDIMNFHGYDYDYSSITGQGTFGNDKWKSGWDANGSFIDGPVMNAKLKYLKGLMGQYNIADKPIISTETALISLAGKTGANFEATKAAYVAESFAYTMANGLLGNIWYDTMGLWAGKNNGLLNSDLTPLPAYNAYKTAVTELDGMAFSREVTNNKNVKVLEFSRADKLVWVAWATTKSGASLSLPSNATAVLDVEGNPLAKTSSLSVTPVPVYVELSK
jgi:hypothetical protein